MRKIVRLVTKKKWFNRKSLEIWLVQGEPVSRPGKVWPVDIIRVSGKSQDINILRGELETLP